MDDTATIQLFRLESRILWDVVDAIGPYRANKDEPLQVSRLGPFVPPLYALGSEILVTTEVRDRIRASCPAMVWCQETVYDDIRELHWHQWDFSKSMPPWEGYSPIFGFDFFSACPPMSREQIDKMKKSWEMRCHTVRSRYYRDPANEAKSKWLHHNESLVLHLTTEGIAEVGRLGVFRDESTETGTIVTARVKKWFECELGEWARFTPQPYKVVDHVDLDEKKASNGSRRAVTVVTRTVWRTNVPPRRLRVLFRMSGWITSRDNDGC